jgi:hypothetical protein
MTRVFSVDMGSWLDVGRVVGSAPVQPSDVAARRVSVANIQNGSLGALFKPLYALDPLPCHNIDANSLPPMHLSKLATLTLLPLALALSSGCSHLSTANTAVPAPAAATASATPASSAAPAPAPKPAVWQDVVISSIPTGATVMIDDQQVGVAPLSAHLEVGQSYQVELLLPGYLISSRNVQAVSSGGGGPSLGKAGLVSYHLVAFPDEVRVYLTAYKDPYRALVKAVAALDAQLGMHKITPDVYREKVAEVTRFYTQGK